MGRPAPRQKHREVVHSQCAPATIQAAEPHGQVSHGLTADRSPPLHARTCPLLLFGWMLSACKPNLRQPHTPDNQKPSDSIPEMTSFMWEVYRLTGRPFLPPPPTPAPTGLRKKRVLIGRTRRRPGQSAGSRIMCVQYTKGLIQKRTAAKTYDFRAVIFHREHYRLWPGSRRLARLRRLDGDWRRGSTA